MTNQRGHTIGGTQIAEMAGVRSSAVSNWRRRHGDFPKAVGTAAGGGDLFLLSDVETWLRDHDRTIHRMDVGSMIWLGLDRARGIMKTEDAVAIALAALALSDRATNAERADVRTAADQGVVEALLGIQARVASEDPSFVPILDIPPGVNALLITPLVQQVFEVDTRAERAEAFEYLLGARRRSIRQGAEHETSPLLAALLVEMAAPVEGDVTDPAAGIGTTLLAAACAAPEGVRVALSGEDINRVACAEAQERLRLHGFNVIIHLRNALANTALREGFADIVLQDAPYQQRLRPDELEPDDPRWVAGTPGRIANFAWLQHALWLTKPGTGRAYVASPPAMTFASGREGRIRSELIRRGCVEAVVALPAGSAGRATGIPIVIWVLRRPEGERIDSSILLIDASGSDRRSEDVLPPTVRAKIVEALHTFRRREFAPSLGFSAAVPITDLLGADVAITPQRWVGVAEENDPIGRFASAGAELTQGREDLAALALPTIDLVPPAERRAPHRIGDLIADGHVELLRGVRIERDDLSDDGIPVLGRHETQVRDPEQRFVRPDAVPPGAPLTQPGDVIIIPGPRSPRAVIDRDGGKVLVGPLVGLRSLREWLPGPLLAAFIEGEHNARAAFGSTVLRVRVQDLEIPNLSEEESALALDAITSLQRQRELATALVQAADDALRSLASGIARGTVVPEIKGSRT